MPTPTEIEDALRVLRQDYWDDVRNIGQEAVQMIEHHELEASEALVKWVNETVDGHQRVIYTRDAILALLCSPNDDEYFEQFGDDAAGLVENGDIAWSKLAYYAMLRDVFDYINEQGFDPYDHSKWYAEEEE